MTDATWGDGAEPPKRSGLPKWLFFCAGGCLLALVLALVAGKLVFDELKGWGDQTEQLPALKTALPFDELPPETEFKFAIRYPMDWFVFSDTRGYFLFFFVASEGEGEQLRKTVLNPEFSQMGMGRRKDSEAIDVLVQGRSVQGLRFVQMRGSGEQGGDAEGQSVLLEVGPEGGSKVVIVQITRGGSEEPITDDEVRTLLEPFHVGPDR